MGANAYGNGSGNGDGGNRENRQGATVVLTNVDQQRKWSTRTNETGEYVPAQIPRATIR
jgi:hypothetical protein